MFFFFLNPLFCTKSNSDDELGVKWQWWDEFLLVGALNFMPRKAKKKRIRSKTGLHFKFIIKDVKQHDGVYVAFFIIMPLIIMKTPTEWLKLHKVDDWPGPLPLYCRMSSRGRASSCCPHVPAAIRWISAIHLTTLHLNLRTNCQLVFLYSYLQIRAGLINFAFW